MSQDDGPLDASDRALLAKAQSLQSGAPPVPWSGPVVIPAAGALDELSGECPVVVAQLLLRGVVASVLGVVHAFGELRPALVRRDDVRAGFAEEGEDLFAPRLHPSAHRRSSRADGTAIRGAAPLRAELVRPQRRTRGRERTHSSLPSVYSAPGGLRQDPGRAV